jgi:excisionase family DNA binding protein
MRRLRNSGEPEIITLQELAELLGTHYQTALKLVRAGEIPGFRLGSDWRFWREDVNMVDQAPPLRTATRGETEAHPPAGKMMDYATKASVCCRHYRQDRSLDNRHQT